MECYLPQLLLESLEGLPGYDRTAFENIHCSGEQVISVRLNNRKIPAVAELAFADAAVAGNVPWSTDGYYLSQRPSFTLDPVFHAGAYYVQEASSMFLEQVLRQTTDLTQSIKVLDLCAAPGGKSTLLQSLISNTSLLVSNEVIKTRVNVLAENITKWGAANVVVTNNDPKDFPRLENYFDVIVVDAPCSGSGLFRRDADLVKEWSPQNVTMCSQRQQRILADVLPALKEGGSLIYSTCSYSESEDETIADWLVEECHLIPVAIPTQPEWGIVETRSPKHQGYGYRFYPDKVKGEGFFIAAFTKGEKVAPVWQSNKYKTKSERLAAKEIDIVQPYLTTNESFFFIKQQDETIALPAHLENELATIQHSLYIKKAGVKMGTIIRNELVPDHELALSNCISKTIHAIEVDKATALQYLRKQEIKLATDLKGWALLTHQQLPLGWIKILPNRINNYYPANWRILNK
ncbi:RNA methyltransferase [Ferruginibacter paludis]|uniref:methyltransferase RsmF C-terminal domain-like protein n=1 Tax=Ferruginibacter paludis TaxID=1310417 RepID=UPI0025B4666B|nr:RNA methyltransferase [Ferruginibacter paludis]MDN3654521.1 RNA methyltransferase [Ferruginibacter paludis]